MPGFYVRPGPGMYSNDKGFDSLSNHENSTNGGKINDTGMLKGIYKSIGPKHRFTDYSKA